MPFPFLARIVTIHVSRRYAWVGWYKIRREGRGTRSAPRGAPFIHAPRPVPSIDQRRRLQLIGSAGSDPPPTLLLRVLAR